jgi:hypothetical protein
MLTILSIQATPVAAERARFSLNRLPQCSTSTACNTHLAASTASPGQYVLRDTIHALNCGTARGCCKCPASAALLGKRVACQALPEFTVPKQWPVDTAPPSATGADELQRYIDQWRMASGRRRADDGRRWREVRITCRWYTLAMGMHSAATGVMATRQRFAIRFPTAQLADNPGHPPAKKQIKQIHA